MYLNANGDECMIIGDFNNFGNAYHVARMRYRKELHAFRRAQRELQQALGEPYEKPRLNTLLNTNSEFDKIISANTENPVPVNKPRHRAERTHFAWFYRLHAWMLSGNV